MSWTNWNEKQNTGHIGMDLGHKKLMGLINQLADGMEHNKSKAFCSDILEKFIELTQAHFLAEEHLMDRYAYPQMAEHKALHTMLIKDVLAFKSSYDAGNAVEFLTLLVILDSWLERDIMEADKKLADFITTAD